MMLMDANKKDKADPIFKMQVKFLINAVKNADTDKDSKITFDEFKKYISKASEESKK